MPSSSPSTPPGQLPAAGRRADPPWSDPWAAIEPATSRRLLLGAVDAFSQKGFHATTTRDIAARAGLSPAALYVHFPSKAALLGQIARVGHEAALALVEHARDGRGDPVDRLHCVVREFTTWHARSRRVARVIAYELAALDPGDRDDVLALRRRIEDVVEGVVVDGVAAGVMHVDQPRPVARAMLALGVDVARWYDPVGSQTPEELGTLYGDLAARMVGAAHGPREDDR